MRILSDIKKFIIQEDIKVGKYLFEKGDVIYMEAETQEQNPMMFDEVKDSMEKIMQEAPALSNKQLFFSTRRDFPELTTDQFANYFFDVYSMYLNKKDHTNIRRNY
jgi:hypothetical protein